MVETVELSDIKRSISQALRLAIGDLTLSLAALDTMVSYWLALATGLPLDSSSIILGNMETKTKLERLKALYQHYGNKGSVASVRRLIKAHREFVDVRNIVAHRRLIGVLKDEPSRLIFTSTKHVAGRVGSFELTAIDLSQITAATKFAFDAADSIFKLTELLEESIAQRSA